MPESANPKVFISYSWSNADHESWVVQLATELRGAGADTILDKWDLKEGHDAFAFMERMVCDADIKKVILVCDQTYATKADARCGGVGAEAQIITPAIYNTQDQSKFVAVIRERDQDGRPCVPAYYSSRIYIDLSEPSSYAENCETLIRWIYDQPLHKKPDIGRKPAFLTETEHTVHLATSVTFRRAIDALKNGRDYAVAALTEYFSLVAREMEKFRINRTDEPFDESVVKSIEAFMPYRDELIDAFMAIALYRDDDGTRIAIHRFFESLIPYLDRPTNVNAWNDTDFDNFKFMIQELFIYCIACFIKHERFEAIASLLQKEFYVRSRSDFGREVMMPFTIFQSHIKSLGARNQRLKLRRLSPSGDLLKERCKGVGVDFDKLMAADFILFMRSKINMSESRGWWPDTLVYVGHFTNHFEIFARSKSTAFFNKVKIALGIDSKRDLEPLLLAMEADSRAIPSWEFDSFNPRLLLGFEAMATKP